MLTRLLFQAIGFSEFVFQEQLRDPVLHSNLWWPSRDERRDWQKTVCYALGLTTCAPGIGVLVLLSVLVGAIFLKAPSAVRRKPARTLKEVAETPLLLYWLYLRGYWASGRMESIKHNACLLKKGRWGGVLGNCRSIKLQFLEKSERNNSTVCKQLGHNTGMSNTQSGFAENKRHPTSHVCFCNCSERNDNNSNNSNNNVLHLVGWLSTLSHMTTSEANSIWTVFSQYGVKQERQKWLYILVQL